MLRVTDPESPFADLLVEMSRDHFEKMAGLATRTYAAQQMGQTIACQWPPGLEKEAGVGVDMLRKGVGLVRRGGSAVKSYLSRGGRTTGRAATSTASSTGPHGTVLESVPHAARPEVAGTAGRAAERAAARRGQSPASMSMVTGPTQMAPSSAGATAAAPNPIRAARPTPGTLAGAPPQPAFPSGAPVPPPGAGTVGGVYRAQPAPGSVPLHPSPSTAPGFTQLPGAGAGASNVRAVNEIERAAIAHMARGTRTGAGQVLPRPPGLTGATPAGASTATGVASPSAQRAAAAGPTPVPGAHAGAPPGGAAAAEMAGAGAGAGAVRPRPVQTPANLPAPGRVAPVGQGTLAGAAQEAGMAPHQLQQVRHIQREMGDILAARAMGRELSPGATAALKDAGRRLYQQQAVMARQAGNPRQADAYQQMAKDLGRGKGLKNLSPEQAQRLLDGLNRGGLAGAPGAVGEVAGAARGAGQVQRRGGRRWLLPAALGVGAVGIPSYAFLSGASQLAQANQGTAWRRGTHGPPINY